MNGVRSDQMIKNALESRSHAPCRRTYRALYRSRMLVNPLMRVLAFWPRNRMGSGFQVEDRGLATKGDVQGVTE